jgi:NAD(P)-dependent dehydrogenase (short-subunit alcohol dehydrogenase family)
MSNSEPTQRIVITGSSSGFGLLTAKSLLTLGYEVVATMRDSTTRKPSKAAELRAFLGRHQAACGSVNPRGISEAPACVGPYDQTDRFKCARSGRDES